MRRSVWSCSSCAASLLGALFGLGLGLGAEAAHAGPKRDLVHRVPKAQITPGPLLQRAASTCKTDYSLCPESVGGGCCPSQYECATDSCYATTAGVTSACGKEGWFACPLDSSGGCCPVGYVCGAQECTAPAGVKTPVTTCPFNYNLCPASLNYGCCMNGMGCALNACYSTTPVTSTIISVVTTTSGGQTITSTSTAITLATPSAPSGIPATDRNVAPKFIPTSVPKISATTVPDDNSSQGLTTAQVGGIVGGVVALLVIVITAAFIIIRRLNRVAEAVESKSKSTSHTKSHSQSQGRTLHLQQGYGDDPSKDPFITPITNNNSAAGTPPIHGVGYPNGHEHSDGFSPSQAAFSPDITGGSAVRHPSVDSAGGYFDLPPRVHNIPGGRQTMTMAQMRSSVDSHSTQGYPAYAYQHQRQQSNASELSDGENQHVTSPFVIPELDSSGAFHELPHDGRVSSLSQNNTYHTRSRSNSGAAASPRASFANPRRRSESGSGSVMREVSPSAPGATLAAGFGPLDVVNESAEIMHGYYGPRDRQVGQTAAGLGEVQWDVSSPMIPGPILPDPLDTSESQAQDEQQQQQQQQQHIHYQQQQQQQQPPTSQQ
ncbi:hypothetical protein B0T16DRAFT_243827 [Cercophora newfieldiana]|uniref:Uncharacterized protein n=1 Tax=Cercophora newfieldiana TaxID=92897 RepID=A0AA39XSQ0_9PEZI|nr:hypothetical protein B0T16DRAFT_243827 [Cercophora newfieldiana]